MSMKRTLHYPYIYIYISSSKTTSKNWEGHFFWCQHQHRIFFFNPQQTHKTTQLSNLVPSSSRPEPEPEHLSLPSNPSVTSPKRQGGGGKSRGNDEGKDSGDKGESSSSALELARCRWWMDGYVGWLVGSRFFCWRDEEVALKKTAHGSC